MARPYIRSFRLEQEFEGLLQTLPKNSANTLVNELLARYFSDTELQASIQLKDERLPGEKAVTLSDAPQPVADPEQELGGELAEAASTVLSQPEAPMPPDFLKKAPTKPVKTLDVGSGVGQSAVEKPVETVDKADADSFLPGF